MHKIISFILPVLLIAGFVVGGFSLPSKVHAAASITISGTSITGNNTVFVRIANGTGSVDSIDVTKWHIDVNTGGVSPLTPTSYNVLTAFSPAADIELVFSGTPFSATDTSYDASHGLYADADAVTDTSANTNVVVAHSSSVEITDAQAPVLDPISIASDGSDPEYANVGATVTLSFTASETLDYTEVNIAGNPADSIDNISGDEWEATYVMQSGDTEGLVDFELYVTDVPGIESNGGNYITATTDSSSVTFDKTAPIISEVTPVTTPTTDDTPSYTFTTDDDGTISYGGSCSSATTSASSGSNTITFTALANGAYTDCTITVADFADNDSNTITVTAFTIASSVPSVTLVSDSGFATQTSPVSITATFSETVTGFALGDLVITRGAAQNLVAVSGTVYTFDIVPTAYGNVRISIPADAAQDSASNGNDASSELRVAYQQGGTGGVGGGYNQNIEEHPGETPAPVISSPCIPVLTSNLTFGQSSDSVKKLQQFLNSHGVVLAEAGPGSPNNETTLFGLLTRAAVVAFQEKYASDILAPVGLISGSGFVGPMTIKKINEVACR